MSFRIRMMKDSDVAAVCKLSKQLGYELNDGQFFGRLSLLAQSKNHSLWVMDSEKMGVAAWMHLERTDRLVCAPRLEIRALVVDEKFRKQGLGKRFVLYAESVARTDNLNEVFLTSNIIREETHAFYERAGYRRVKTSHAFVKGLD